MLTDWVLIRRLGDEIEHRLSKGRVVDAGLLDDGRLAIAFRHRGSDRLLVFDLFESPPVITAEEGELGIGIDPGFARVLARSLRGMLLSKVEARRHDRLLRLRFTSRSRFGVGEELELYVELVPRFGNAVLVKDGVVVAAHKEFSSGRNARRAIAAGAPYLLPPVPERPRVLGHGATAESDGHAPLFVYRRDGNLLQAYVEPLAGFEDATETREGSLLDIFAELRSQQAAQDESARNATRRASILKQLDKREARLRQELDSLDEKRRRAQDRDGLRAQGEAIFATLHTMPQEIRADAKERAAALFAEYKKLGKSLPHLERRELATRAALEAVETLRWEAERAGEDDVAAVEAAARELEPRRATAAPSARQPRKRPLLEVTTLDGSRIVVGRSPIENAQLTFQLARPYDLWFHARQTPGAHVILTRDDRKPAPDADVEIAASLAAFYSRSKASSSVPVDYTLRKHVRKRRAAPPGLVWYTSAKTVIAAPKSIDQVRALVSVS
ncbi:MAG TPA: NFACT RNA binding domain-containing protein [Candidatus Babeliales bacterium]|nr:NFACT RNA binding domain-containing protein [Candidatus Babeliales bacterium]